MFSTSAPSKQLLQCKNRVFVEQRDFVPYKTLKVT